MDVISVRERSLIKEVGQDQLTNFLGLIFIN
jgi:hypothetical protein